MTPPSAAFLVVALLIPGAGWASVLWPAQAQGGAVALPDPAMPEVEIRAYLNWVPNRPPGSGNGVFLYGMRVREDGSETVVWSRKVFEPAGLLWDLGKYEVAGPSSERAYIYFSEGIGGQPSIPRPPQPLLWEVDRRSGQVLRALEGPTPEFKRLRSSLTWWPLPVELRPRPARWQPQREMPR